MTIQEFLQCSLNAAQDGLVHSGLFLKTHLLERLGLLTGLYDSQIGSRLLLDVFEFVRQSAMALENQDGGFS